MSANDLKASKKLQSSFISPTPQGGPGQDHINKTDHIREHNIADEISERTFQDVSLCYQCGKCSAGCPVRYYMDIAPNKVVRLIQLGFYAIEKGVEISQKNIIKFHNAFLDQIKSHGRSYEVGLVAEYKMKTMDLFQDVDSAPGMFFKGKLGLLPHNIKDRKGVKSIFKKTSGK